MHYSIINNTVWSYTYEQYNLGTTDWEYIVTDLDEMGEEGWELSGMHQHGDTLTLILKQPDGHEANQDVIQQRRMVRDMMAEQRRKAQSMEA